MLTIKENIRKCPELQRILEKSMRKRYRKLEKTKCFCNKSKEDRELALGQEYPMR